MYLLKWKLLIEAVLLLKKLLFDCMPAKYSEGSSGSMKLLIFEIYSQSITARIRRMGKVMFPQACVCRQMEGVPLIPSLGGGQVPGPFQGKGYPSQVLEQGTSPPPSPPRPGQGYPFLPQPGPGQATLTPPPPPVYSRQGYPPPLPSPPPPPDRTGYKQDMARAICSCVFTREDFLVLLKKVINLLINLCLINFECRFH